MYPEATINEWPDVINPWQLRDSKRMVKGSTCKIQHQTLDRPTPYIGVLGKIGRCVESAIPRNPSIEKVGVSAQQAVVWTDGLEGDPWGKKNTSKLHTFWQILRILNDFEGIFHKGNAYIWGEFRRTILNEICFYSIKVPFSCWSIPRALKEVSSKRLHWFNHRSLPDLNSIHALLRYSSPHSATQPLAITLDYTPITICPRSEK